MTLRQRQRRAEPLHCSTLAYVQLESDSDSSFLGNLSSLLRLKIFIRNFILVQPNVYCFSSKPNRLQFMALVAIAIFAERADMILNEKDM